MKVLFVASEASPFIKVGGLGDVMGALPKELVKKGVDARVVIPLYSAIGQKLRQQIEYKTNCYVNNSWRNTCCGLFTARVDGVTYYFIDNEQYFKRNVIYGAYDDGERFAFFSRAVLDMLPAMDFFPDIINVNDWHTAILPVYLNVYYRHRSEYAQIRTVLSIHNIEFQGKYDPYILGSIFGLDIYHRSLLMYDGDLNILKAGIECVDLVSTVSRTYAEEILQPEQSFGLHNILRARREKLRGIVNGIDTEVFNPETDPAVATHYTAATVHNKVHNKRRLQRSLALEDSGDVPVIGMVTRLTSQKGMDLFYEVMGQLLELPLQLVLLGTGDPAYESFLSGWEQARRDKVRSIIKFSGEMASQIYAGADLFLMPSRSEPCGLSQMIAMRYGTVPIVHTVGGLADTVQAFNPQTGEGNGITFQSYNAYDMLDAVRRAIAIYYERPIWRQLRKNAMGCDFSWNRPAEEYIAMYRELL